MSHQTKTYLLSPAAVDEISEEIGRFCAGLHMDSKAISGHRIAAEESLTLWMERLGEGTQAELEFGKKLFRNSFSLKIKGARFNPYNDREKTEKYGTAANDILIRVGLIPEFNYRDGTNILLFRLQKKPKNQILVLLSIIFASLVVGFLGKWILGTDVLASISENLITPLEDTFFSILSAIAGPMIFLSVAWGVYGIGDVYTLGRIGKKLMLAFLKTIFLFVCIGTVFYPFLGPPLSEASIGANQFSNIFRMLLSIFPANIFSPFVEGNTLQIIFLGFIIGLSLIFLGQRTSSVARAVEQINHIINFMMEFVSKLVPYFVFIVLVNLIWTDAFSAFGQVWRFTAVFLVAMLGCDIAFLGYVCIRHKENPLRMFKTVLPSYLIAVATASSSATFESNMKICNRKFRIQKEFSSFSIPFGMVVFKPTTALYYLLICFYFASVYAVPVSASWIVTAVVITAIAAIATPPIPGGAAATYTILLAQLGIDGKALALVLAVDMIFDFLLTSSDMYLLLLQIFHSSSKLNMRDTTVKGA